MQRLRTQVSYVCSTPDCDRVLPRKCPTGLCKGCYQLRYRKKYHATHTEEIAQEPKVTHDPFLAKLDELRALLITRRPNPLTVAKIAFGSKRLNPDGPCLTLDGKPINYHALMRKTNEQLVHWRLPQLTAEPGWVVAITVDSDES